MKNRSRHHDKHTDQYILPASSQLNPGYCQDMEFLNFYFDQFYSDFIGDYSLFHRQSLNDFMTLTNFMISLFLNEPEWSFHWDATDE